MSFCHKKGSKRLHFIKNQRTQYYYQQCALEFLCCILLLSQI